MPYGLFYEEFPDLAEKETRVLTVFNTPGLPAGQYAFAEAYCDEPGCDCRRVFFDVIEVRTKQLKAVIAYGWESREFYADWFGEDDALMVEEMQGPVLNTMSRQSPLAPALLKLTDVLLQDKDYIERLKRHYAMYREAIDKKHPRKAAAQKKKYDRKRGIK